MNNAAPAGGGEEKLSRFPQTPHHKPRRDCLLLQRCKVLGLLQTRNFTLFILILIDKMRWDGLSRDFLIDGRYISIFFESWKNLNSFHLHIGKIK